LWGAGFLSALGIIIGVVKYGFSLSLSSEVLSCRTKKGAFANSLLLFFNPHLFFIFKNIFWGKV